MGGASKKLLSAQEQHAQEQHAQEQQVSGVVAETGAGLWPLRGDSTHNQGREAKP
jgi:hypothetical protein